MKKFTIHLTTCFVILGSVACTGSDQQAETADTEAPVEVISVDTKTPNPDSACIEVFLRQRDCTSDFIPALIDARIRLDVPPGIAARAAEEGRDTLIAVALNEWASDSRDAAVEATCKQMVAQMPAEAFESLLSASRACLEESECSAFTACIVPVMEGHLR